MRQFADVAYTCKSSIYDAEMDRAQQEMSSEFSEGSDTQLAIDYGR